MRAMQSGLLPARVWAPIVLGLSVVLAGCFVAIKAGLA